MRLNMKIRTNKIVFGENGQALLELALVLPLLVLLALGVFDFSRAIHAKNIITNVSREGASLASRSSLPQTDIMNALAYTAQPLDMNNRGMIYITKVTGGINTTGSNVHPIIQDTINDQTRWKGKTSPQSKVWNPTDANTNAKNLGTLSLNNGDAVYVVEVFYDYQSIFSIGNKMLQSHKLYSMTIF